MPWVAAVEHHHGLTLRIDVAVIVFHLRHLHKVKQARLQVTSKLVSKANYGKVYKVTLLESVLISYPFTL